MPPSVWLEAGPHFCVSGLLLLHLLLPYHASVPFSSVPLFPPIRIEGSQTSLVRVVVLRRQSDGRWAFMYGRLAPRNRPHVQKKRSHFTRTTANELRSARASTCTFLLPIPPEESSSPPALSAPRFTQAQRSTGKSDPPANGKKSRIIALERPNQSRIPSLGPPPCF